MEDLPTPDDPIDEEIESMGWANIQSIAAKALTDTAEGAEARMLLPEDFDTGFLSPLDLTDPPDASRSFLTAPEKESVGDLTLPLAWKPKSSYDFDPRNGTVQIRVESPGPRVRAELKIDQIHDGVPDDLLPTHFVTSLQSALRNVRDCSHLPTIRARMESARKRQERVQERAEEMLIRIREVLFAWVLVGLEGEEHGQIPPQKKREVWFSPKSNTGGSTSRKAPSRPELESKPRERQRLREKYSPSGLFIREVRYLWTLITKRRLRDHKMQAIAGPLDVPKGVTEAASFAVEALYSELLTIDEEVVPFQAKRVACRIREEQIDSPDTSDSPTERPRSTTRKIKIRTVITYHLLTHRGVSPNDKDDLNQLLSAFIEWDSGEEVNRPVDAVYDAIGYHPGRGRGDFEEAMELLHDSIPDFEKELGEQIVENLDRIVDNWFESRAPDWGQ